MPSAVPTPITILTGFLGSGKTTLLLKLLPQLPTKYGLALLKNEFGDVEVDSRLASQGSIAGVTELLNGWLVSSFPPPPPPPNRFLFGITRGKRKKKRNKEGRN